MMASCYYGPTNLLAFVAAADPACDNRKQMVNKTPIIRGWFFKNAVMSDMVHSENSAGL